MTTNTVPTSTIAPTPMTAPTMLPQSPLPLSAVDRLHLQNLYLCVRLKGRLSTGSSGYCYFGIFVEPFLKMLDHLRQSPAVNPKDFGAIVLARSTGEPSPEIQQFMEMKFSFAPEDEAIILELSRGK
jgi:hypothetical protein